MGRVVGKPGVVKWVQYSGSLFFKNHGPTRTTFVRPNDPPVSHPGEKPLELVEVPDVPITISFSEKNFMTSDGAKIDEIDFKVTVRPRLDLDPGNAKDVDAFTNCAALYMGSGHSSVSAATERLRSETRIHFDTLGKHDFEALATANEATPATGQPQPLARQMEAQIQGDFNRHNFRVIEGTCIIHCVYPTSADTLNAGLPEHAPLIKYFEKRGTFDGELKRTQQKWIDDRINLERTIAENEAQLKADHDKNMEEMKNLYDLEKKRLTGEHERRKEDLTNAQKREVDQARNTHDQETQRLTDEHAEKTKGLEDAHTLKTKELEDANHLKRRELEDARELNTKKFELALKEALSAHAAAVQATEMREAEQKRVVELKTLLAEAAHSGKRTEVEIEAERAEGCVAEARVLIKEILATVRAREGALDQKEKVRALQETHALQERELALRQQLLDAQAAVPRDESEVGFDASQVQELRRLGLEARRKHHADAMKALEQARELEAHKNEVDLLRRRRDIELDARREELMATVLPALVETQAMLARREWDGQERREFVRLSGEQITNAIGAAKGMVDELRIVAGSGDTAQRLFAALQSLAESLFKGRTPDFGPLFSPAGAASGRREAPASGAATVSPPAPSPARQPDTPRATASAQVPVDYAIIEDGEQR